jgi:glycolate oxidase
MRCAMTAYRCPPLAVVLPATTEEVAAVLKFCHAEGVPVVPRGAGTSLAGGSLPTADSVVLGVSRMNGCSKPTMTTASSGCRPGAPTCRSPARWRRTDFFYAPDPSSQLACAIAGNIAMNSGGAHCLKYGVTTNNLMGVTMVTMEGDMVEIGGAHLDAPVYDLLGVICGSEGQLGVVTEATLRILPKPEGARPVLMGFDSAEVAGACVADIIKAGVLPVAIEFMDRPCIRATEAFAKAGYPDVRGPADRRGRRLRGRDRRAARQDQAIAMQHNPASCAKAQVPNSPRHLEGPQGRLWRDGPDQRLHVP